MNLLSLDAINGKAGIAYANIKEDGVNKRVELFRLQNITATATQNKTDFPALGTKVVQQKVTGVSLEGSMELYYGTPYFKRMILKTIKGQGEQFCEIVVINNDASVQDSIGQQIATLREVSLNAVDLAKLDISADLLNESVSFTFGDIDFVDEFADNMYIDPVTRETQVPNSSMWDPWI